MGSSARRTARERRRSRRKRRSCLRSDRYDPRALVDHPGSPLQAISQLVSTLVSRTRALALPDSGSAQGEPFRIFRDLASYEAQVLRAERPPVDDIF